LREWEKEERTAACSVVQAEEVMRDGEKEEERRRWAALGWNERREGRWIRFFQTFLTFLKFKLFSKFSNFTQTIKPCI
jgi:hypothetical protein